MLKRNQKSHLLTILILLLIIVTSNFAQTGKLKGKVTDKINGDPLPGANVILVDKSIGAACDYEGNFLLRSIPVGKYKVRVSYIGYDSYEFETEIIENRTLEMVIELEPVGVEGETVVVTAQASGQNEAINQQLTSIQIKNVVSMARIQELPDANAAESVARLPGVSLIRTGGEGSKVVVRGLSPQYNRVTIDGVELPANATSSDPNDHRTQYGTADGLSLSGDRATDLSMISSNMLGGIEVVKAITPDMDATVIGGVINFSMRKARTDEGKPKYEVLSQGSYNGLKDKYNNYKLVGSYEQRYFENSFGVFLQGSIEQKNLSSNQLSSSYFFDGKIEVTDEGDPEFGSMNLSDIVRDRERYGATLVLDYQHESGSIGFLNFYSRSNTTTINRNENYQLEGNDLFYAATHGINELDVYSNLLSIKQNIFGFGIEAKLSHSYSGSTNPEDVRFNFWQDGAGFANKINSLKYATTQEVDENVIYNPEEAVFFDIYNITNQSEDRTINAALDIVHDYALSDMFAGKIKVGASYQYRARSYNYDQSSGSVFYDDGGQVSADIRKAYPDFGDEITYSDFIDNDYSYGDFLDGDYTMGLPMDTDLMLDVIEIAKKHPGAGNGGGYKPHKLSSLLYDYEGDESRSAAYAMTTLKIGNMFSVIPGVRYQNLTSTYQGIRGEQIPNGIQYTEAEETVSHGYLLPMVHLRVEPFNWLQFHFAYTNTLNYPDYNTIIPGYYIGTNFVKYNNHNLKPARSENFDAVLTFYSNEIGLFSIGGFKKNIKDLVFSSRTYPSDFSAYPELEEILEDRTESYSLLTYINNPIKIDVYGIETEWQTHFWYLPEPLSGIVLNINYTHIFSEADYPKTFLTTYLDENFIQRTKANDTSYSARLLNQPNDILNISLGFDYSDFSLRVSMLYQDNIFKQPEFWLQNRIHSDKYVRFDLSAKQTLPWYGIQVFMNLNNISGEDDIDVNQKTGYVTARQKYGMTADFGIRVNL